MQALQMMPDTAMVGLVTYGSMVYVHELGFTDFPKAYLLRGDREPTLQDLQAQLGLGLAAVKRGTASADASGFGRFLVNVREGSFLLESAIEELRPDPLQVRHPGPRLLLPFNCSHALLRLFFFIFSGPGACARGDRGVNSVPARKR